MQLENMVVLYIWKKYAIVLNLGHNFFFVTTLRRI
jgi:hypothetical protein